MADCGRLMGQRLESRAQEVTSWFGLPETSACPFPPFLQIPHGSSRTRSQHFKGRLTLKNQDYPFANLYAMVLGFNWSIIVTHMPVEVITLINLI
jgi:hypothetical protein